MCSQPKHLSDIPQCKTCAYVSVRECSGVGSRPGGRPFTCLDTRRLPLSKNYFQMKGEQLPGILVVISCLNNLPVSCWNAKKTSYKTTNVSYLFPFGASQQKQNNIIGTYVEFLKASNSSVISGCEVKAYFPIPFMKMGFECSPPVFNSVAQFSSCLPFLTVCRDRCPHITWKSPVQFIISPLLCHFLWFVFPSFKFLHIRTPFQVVPFLFPWIPLLLVPTVPYLSPCLRPSLLLVVS